MASISNNEIKKVKALSQKKFRDESGLFTVEGEKLVNEAVRSSFTVEKVYEADVIGEDAMARITSLSSPSPVLAVVRKPSDAYVEDVAELDDLLSQGGLFLALDTIRDPGNLGTIIRIADWFGIKAVFATRDTVDVFNPKVVQATMGAIFRVRMHYVDLQVLSRAVLSHGGRIFGTFLDGENMYSKVLDNGDISPSMIVIGNESNGISGSMSALVTDRLYIPPYPADQPGSESLNAAIATAITVAEFRRRSY
ncbi:MAG: RNA methyltransferase [Bacteroidales bacterium]|nr:RNA methyltransferase [Bacteroidales bacterium]